MSDSKTGYPREPAPPYTERTPAVGTAGVGGVPPQYGGNYNTQYGQSPLVTVVQPGAYVTQGNIAAGEQYNGIFIGSIVVTFLCCWPIGFLAIQRARQAQTAAIMGRIPEAEQHADTAKKFIIASVVGGVVFIGVIIGIVLALGG